MILDTLSNAKGYAPQHRLFARAFGFLSTPGLLTLAPGRIDIEGAELYAMVSSQPGRPRAEAPLEAHRKYIDIQYLLSGKETIGWRPTADCVKPSSEYRADNDIAFFADEPLLWPTLHTGMFAVFFPWDAHAPLVGDGSIHKVVIKVAL